MTLIAALMVGVGIAIGIHGIALRGKERREALTELLEYELVEPSKSPEALSEMMERLGAFAERAFGETSTADKLRAKLSQAGSSLKAGEFGAIVATVSVALAILSMLLTGSALAALTVAVATPFAALARLKAKGRKRLLKLETQLPEVLQLLAGSLDAGASLLLAMELAGQEGEPPLSKELARVVAECRVGRPLIEALEAMAERVGSKDVLWTVEAIRIQHQTGGRLADTLMVLADFMRTRVEVRGEVRALSAEARISGKVLIAMPIGIGAFLFMTRRSYLEPLLSTGMGRIMVVGALVGIFVGHLWMRKLSQVEV
ncbi:MAG TPA: type II secretion system F family protein [Actinomycetota bacterium]|nr:type II secretion system F family protein [Actinomycetota bacterium]